MQLNVNERQKGQNNIKWRNILSRIRIAAHCEDVKTLEDKIISQNCDDKDYLETIIKHFIKLMDSGDNPVCLLPTRRMVSEFNTSVIKALNKNTLTILAVDKYSCTIKSNISNAQIRLRKLDQDSRNTGGLENTLKIAPGIKVMLRKNLDVSKKLVNGTIGTISNIIQDKEGVATTITIKFEGIHELVDIHRDTKKIKIFDNAYVFRNQFPLTVSYAMSIHKSQGLSLKTVITDVGSSIFDCGQTFVALSRCSSLEGLHLINFSANKIYASNQALAEYARLGLILQKKQTIHTVSKILKNVYGTQHQLLRKQKQLSLKN